VVYRMEQEKWDRRFELTHVILRVLHVMQYMDESLPFSLFIYF